MNPEYCSSQLPKPPIRLTQVFGPVGSEGSLANEAQRRRFCDMVMRIISEPPTEPSHILEDTAQITRSCNEDIKVCLREMYIRYDHGGISVGRSLRAVLLDGVTTHFKKGNLVAARACLGPLLAMYYSPEYATNHSWYEFPSSHEFPYDHLSDLSLLTLIGLMLDMDELPPVREISATEAYDLLGGVGKS